MGEPTFLEPDFSHSKPQYGEMLEMSRTIELKQTALPDEPFFEFVNVLRESHSNGGAYLAAFDVSESGVFDWYASRNRLAEDGVVDLVLAHPRIRAAIPDLRIPESQISSGLTMADPFLFDGRLARCIFNGGAYSESNGDGRSAKTLALQVCDAMFQLRFGEIVSVESFEPWTPWFHGIAWDLTEVIFDRRLRRLWIFALTDTD